MVPIDLFLLVEIAFHARRRNTPKRLGPIEILKFCPLRPTQVAGANSGEREEAKRQAGGIDWSRVTTTLEYGPGTGVFISAILARLQPPARLIAIDTSPSFTDHLASAIPDQRLHVVTGSAADAPQLMADQGLLQTDCVISGLPFSTLEPAIATQIIDRSVQLLSPDGLFMAYQMRTAARPLLEHRFASVRSAYEWRNIPPCHL